MATVKIFRLTGSTPTETDITSINTRLNATDAHSTGGTTNPIKIPDSGTNYSYWATTRLNVTDNPDSNTVDNMKWYTDGSMDYGTGVGMNVAAASGYVQATGAEGETGDELGATHTDLINTVTGAGSYTSASPMAIDTSNTGTSSTGFIGDWIAQQVTVDSTAGVGATSTETLTFQFDIS